MPLSDRAIIKFGSTSNSVLEYSPKVFTGDMTEEAKDYLRRRKQRDFDFRLSDEVRDQTKVADAERVEQEEQVELRALEKLKEVEEGAYKEAYAIGLEEGKAKAFKEFTDHLLENLLHLAEVARSLGSLKTDLVKFNEAHIVNTIIHMASRVAMREVTVDRSAIIDIVRQAVEQAQSSEEIRVQVSPEDLEFLTFLRTESPKEMEALKDIEFEVKDEIKPGGCIVETNYGVVDATIEERVEKLWTALKGTIPISKDRVG